MKTQLKLAGLLLLSSFILHPSTLLAQGSLTPPGAPAATMKTLSQIEPRTPIASAPYTINAPGSYYLTTNLTLSSGDAITIATNGVTLDLGGFTISSTAPSATGNGVTLVAGMSDITILNGHIRGGVTNNGSGTYSGSGFAAGIRISDTTPPTVNVRLSGLSISGCLTWGIRGATVVESCTIRTVGGTGIIATTIKTCTAEDCGGDAISGEEVSDCRGAASTSGFGVNARTALNCYGSSSSGQGLYATATAQNCYGTTSSGIYGLQAPTAQNCSGSAGGTGTGLYGSDVAIGCRGYSASGIGLRAYIANSCRVAAGTTNITFKYNMP